MGFDEGKIVLDSNTGVYYAGETVQGKLIFSQDKVKIFRGIYMQVKGYAEVHWSTSHTRRVNNRSETYHVNHNSYEEYFRTKQYMVGSANGEHQLQPGHYEFPFQCHIPKHCPSSFEGSHGKIRYKIKIVVDRAFKLDQEKKTTFEVVAQLDLNNFPDLRDPLQMEVVESYCCLCWKSGGSSTRVKLPRRAAVPGEALPAELCCENTSTVAVDRVRLRITKLITYHAHENPATKTEESSIVEVKKGPVLPGTTKSWAVELDLPLMDVNYLAACQIINVQYYFEIKVYPSGCHNNSEESSEITIGTLPFRPLEEVIPPCDQVQTAYPVVNAPLPQAIITQPYPGGNPPYPGGNPVYPGGNSPYPGGNPPIPGGNSPYPGGNPPYPGGNPPYPGGNAPYPGGNPPYSGGNAPYPGGNPPYPGGNAPYPGGNAPYPGGNPPYPGGNPPFPGGNSPNPGGITPYPGWNMPYTDANGVSSANPSVNPARLPGDGSPGPALNTEAAPLLPYPNNSGPPQVNPYSAASAPPPSATPDNQYPYNPDFIPPANK